MKKETYALVETAVLTAIAVLLEVLATFIPILQMPQGGRISLVLLPAIIVSLRRGFVYGTISGFIVGIVVFMLDGFFIHWGSIIFDYFLAFSLVGLTAIFKKDAFKNNLLKFILAITLASVLRYLMHGFSGVIFFGDFTEGDSWFYSFVVYNIPYNLGSYLLMLAVGIILYPQLNKILPEERV